jgi:Tol biopolymer transport system component
MHTVRFAVVLVAVALASGPAFAAQPTVAAPPYASTKALPEPALFGEGVVSTPENETSLAFTPDGRSVYFTIGTPNNSFSAIVVSRFEGGRWKTPEMASFSGQYKDQEPAISPDGSRLFFASTRPMNQQPKSETDIWVVDRTPSGWSEPKNVGPIVNTGDPEGHPWVARDGTLYFNSRRPGGKGGADIYRSRLVNGEYAAPENLGPGINGESGEMMGCVAADGSFLIFSSSRGPQRNNLYLSRWDGAAWQSPIDLGPKVNTQAEESSASLSPDGKYLFFHSNRRPEVKVEPRTKPVTRAEIEAEAKKQAVNVLNGKGNLYQVDMETVMKTIADAKDGVQR